MDYECWISILLRDSGVMWGSGCEKGEQKDASLENIPTTCRQGVLFFHKRCGGQYETSWSYRECRCDCLIPDTLHVRVTGDTGWKGRFSGTNKNSLCHSNRFWMGF